MHAKKNQNMHPLRVHYTFNQIDHVPSQKSRLNFKSIQVIQVCVVRPQLKNLCKILEYFEIINVVPKNLWVKKQLNENKKTAHQIFEVQLK